MPLLEEMGYEEHSHRIMMRKAANANRGIETAIRLLADGYVDLYGLDVIGGIPAINRGMCEAFAKDIVSIIPDARAVWDDDLDTMIAYGSHCVIVYGGRYYDAECPEGSDDFRDLPYYQRIKVQSRTSPRPRSQHHP